MQGSIPELQTKYFCIRILSTTLFTVGGKVGNNLLVEENG